MPYDIGSRIRAARLKKGLTQEELAKLTGTTKQNIYKYETGVITNIPLDRIESIADTLSVQPSDLVGWEDANPGMILAEDEHRLIVAWRGAEQAARQIAYETLLHHQKKGAPGELSENIS